MNQENYPRPQMVRSEWRTLNGRWKIRTGGKISGINVPFCPESRMSGFEGTIIYGRKIAYRRLFRVPEAWGGRRILLHFGAVSREAAVKVNGRTVARHSNAYLPFSADITEFLKPGKNELIVTAVNDLSQKYPWGKQKKDRGGMWYTPVSGIWQTVWIESVPEEYIQELKIRTEGNRVEITAVGVRDGRVILGRREGFSGKGDISSGGDVSSEGGSACGEDSAGEEHISSEGELSWDGAASREILLKNGTAQFEIENPQWWSPGNPFLYHFAIVSGEDRVESYFALRTLTTKRINGIPRLCLNGKPYFFHGLLDQGYWESGLYTPPEPDAFAQDILAMKELGFNTLRKHIKIEPEQFYYDCDRLGMIVFQDMVNNGDYKYLRDTVLPTIGVRPPNDLHIHRDPETRENFLAAMDETVRLLSNHPCICLWTIFNEGWGQFCADEAYDRLRSLDDTRFIDSTSGWFHQKKSDVDSRHMYFEKLHLGIHDLPQLLSEFGGWSLKIPGHCFNNKKTYSYRKYDDRDVFVRELRKIYLEQVIPLAKKGLCGALYTQVSDVEDETNGLVTFDRAVQKIMPEEFRDIGEKLQKAVE